MTEAEVAQIRELNAAGATVTQIAQAVGCDRETVKAYLNPDYRAKRREGAIRYRQRVAQCARTNPVTPGLNPRVAYKPPKDANPLYDPQRDGGPIFVSTTQYLMGDPPAGRRELLDKWAAANPPRVRGQRSSVEELE